MVIICTRVMMVGVVRGSKIVSKVVLMGFAKELGMKCAKKRAIRHYFKELGLINW